jgi:hypothetical protein
MMSLRDPIFGFNKSATRFYGEETGNQDHAVGAEHSLWVGVDYNQSV